MARFSYSAISDDGKRVSGAMEGADRSLVLSRLSAQGLHPVSIVEEKERANSAKLFGLTRRRIAPDEITVFTRQLSWLLDAGTTLNRALEIMAGETFSTEFSAVLNGLQADIRKGKTFHSALTDTGIFAPFYLTMVEVGETTGTLSTALDRLATARETEQKMRGKVISALAYPLLLVVLSIGVVAFIMVAVVPGIKSMILESGEPVPEEASFVIAISDWLVANGMFVTVGLASFAAAFIPFWRNTRLSWLLREMSLRVPIVGRLIIKIEVTQFCRILGALTAAGMNLQRSLKIISASSLNRRITETTKRMEVALRRGEDFIAPLEASRIFPPLLGRMLKVGSETGNLAPGIIRASEILEDELDRTIERSLSLLGPIIILTLSVFVGFIIVSLMSAVISINDLAM